MPSFNKHTNQANKATGNRLNQPARKASPSITSSPPHSPSPQPNQFNLQTIKRMQKSADPIVPSSPQYESPKNKASKVVKYSKLPKVGQPRKPRPKIYLNKPPKKPQKATETSKRRKRYKIPLLKETDNASIAPSLATNVSDNSSVYSTSTSTKKPKRRSGRTRIVQIKPTVQNVKVKDNKAKPPEKNKIDSKTSLKSPVTIRKEVEDVMHLDRLKRDGRKTPDYYRKHVLAISSPSQLSLKSITEYYNLLSPPLNTSDDVFTYRGYKKLSKIDEGAFGIVSKAIRLSDKTLVAVKEVDLRRKRAKRIEEMKRELFVLQKIDSKNIVKLIEHFVIGQMLVIVLEYCAGSNLTTYLKDTAINEQEALHLFRQMATSIKVLHKKGIAHRDVKLNNFLLDSSRKIVKVGDFGLSIVSYRQAYGVLMAKTYCGTEPYMAPEILRRNSMGSRSYNPLYSDIWSLGVCLFAMLTRTFPFKMQLSQQELHKAQVSRKWRFPRSLRDTLSEEIKDLVWHMLDPEGERRITIIGVLSHPWLNYDQLVALSYDESERASLK